MPKSSSLQVVQIRRRTRPDEQLECSVQQNYAGEKQTFTNSSRYLSQDTGPRCGDCCAADVESAVQAPTRGHGR